MAELDSVLSHQEPNLQLLLKQSVRYSFFQAMRQIETSFPELPRVGCAASPNQESFRIQQPADLAFAPNTIDSIKENGEGKLAVEQRFFGLLGPSGPLPLHLTENGSQSRSSRQRRCASGVPRYFSSSHGVSLLSRMEQCATCRAARSPRSRSIRDAARGAVRHRVAARACK